jgi:hypothetical protein
VSAYVVAEGDAVTSTGAPLTVVFPAHQPGDMLIVLSIVALHNDVEGLLPGEDEIATENPDLETVATVTTTHLRFRLRTLIASPATPASVMLTLNSAITQGPATTFAARAWSVRGVGLVPIDEVTVSPVYTAAGAATPLINVDDPDRLALLFFANADPQGVGTLPGFTPGVGSVSTTGSGAAMQLFSRGPVGVDIPPTTSGTPAALTGGYVFLALTIIATNITAPVLPPRPQRLALQCADSYRVFVTRNSNESAEDQIIDELGWNDIEWSRTLDEISTAAVTVPDRYSGVFCLAAYGGLRPWYYGLRILCNDQLVWRGPVTGVSRPSGEFGTMPAIRVTASDMLARFELRLATRQFRLYENVDTGQFVRTILSETAKVGYPNDGFVLEIPSVYTGVGITRELVPKDFEYAWQVVRDLLESSVDMYVLNGELIIFHPGLGWIRRETSGIQERIDGPYLAGTGELLYGLFTAQAYTERPGWSISGWNQANQTWVSSTDQGTDGARRFWTAADSASILDVGVLDFVETTALYRSSSDAIIPDAAFQAQAASALQLRASPPAIIEGGALADGAPIDRDNLRPGSIWLVDIYDAGYGQLRQPSRLKRVTVRVTRNDDGLTEQISPVLYPLGHTEATL